MSSHSKTDKVFDFSSCAMFSFTSHTRHFYGNLFIANHLTFSIIFLQLFLAKNSGARFKFRSNQHDRDEATEAEGDFCERREELKIKTLRNIQQVVQQNTEISAVEKPAKHARNIVGNKSKLNDALRV